jgi:hypothetical protein
MHGMPLWCRYVRCSPPILLAATEFDGVFALECRYVAVGDNSTVAYVKVEPSLLILIYYFLDSSHGNFFLNEGANPDFNNPTI